MTTGTSTLLGTTGQETDARLEAVFDRLVRHSASLHEVVVALIDLPFEPDSYLEAHPEHWMELLRRVDELVARGLIDGDRTSSLDFHRTLHRLFRLATAAHDNRRELAWHLAGLRTRMVQQWMAIEVDRSPKVPVPQLGTADVEPWFRQLVIDNAAVDHPLYRFLEKNGTVDDFRYFMQQEATVDADFVDLLALTQLGMDDPAKSELAHNFWDEMGNGDRAWEHALMFAESLRGLGVPQVEDDDLSLEALACGNLLWATSLFRCFHRYSIGALGALETASPTRFRRLANACLRLSLPEVIFRYYDMHVAADHTHSTGWIRNVVQPMVLADEMAAVDIAVGVELRLATSRRYCDALYESLTGNGSA